VPIVGLSEVPVCQAITAGRSDEAIMNVNDLERWRTPMVGTIGTLVYLHEHVEAVAKLLPYSEPMHVRLLRSAALLLCGATAHAADVCSGVTEATRLEKVFPQKGGELGLRGTDVATATSFRFRVRASGPSLLITVHSFPVDGDKNEQVRAGEIDVARCEDGNLVQTLPILASRSFNFGQNFGAFDINFDGSLDFSVLVETGATFGSQSWWIYEPASGTFIQNELTRGLREVASDGYRIDQKKHELIADHLLYGCPPLVTRYRIEANRLVTIHEEEGFQGAQCAVTYHDLVKGRMKVTGTRRFNREER
jgi:hypothetical protein